MVDEDAFEGVNAVVDVIVPPHSQADENEDSPAVNPAGLRTSGVVHGGLLWKSWCEPRRLADCVRLWQRAICSNRLDDSIQPSPYKCRCVARSLPPSRNRLALDRKQA